MIVKLHEHLNSVTVDHLLLLTNSFHEWYRINLFVAPNFRNKNLDYLVNAMLQTFEAKFAARNIRNDETLANLVKIFWHANKCWFTVNLLNFSVLEDQVPVV